MAQDLELLWCARRGTSKKYTSKKHAQHSIIVPAMQSSTILGPDNIGCYKGKDLVDPRQI